MNGPLIYDPRGIVDAVPQAIAKRLGKLEGLRLGILDNTKWNANRLLKKTAAQLQAEHKFSSVNYYRKESFSKAADDAIIQQIARENDLTMTAIGD